MTFSFIPELGPDTRANRDATVLVLAFCDHKRVSLRAGELTLANGQRAEENDLEACADFRQLNAIYSDVVYVEEQLGLELPMPAQVTTEDLNVLGTVANVLQTGEGTATFSEASGMVDDPLNILSAARRFRQTVYRPQGGDLHRLWQDPGPRDGRVHSAAHEGN